MGFQHLVVLAALLLCTTFAHESPWNKNGIFTTTQDDFDKVINGSFSYLVAFAASWCAKSLQLQHEYHFASLALQPHADVVRLVHVDGEENPVLTKRFSVDHYPTMLFFEKGDTTPERYDGPSDAQGITEWVSKRLGLTVPRHTSGHVESLTPETFQSVVSERETQESVLVAFHQSDCAECRQLQPIFDRVAKVFKREQGVVLVSVDVSMYPDLGSRYNIEKYPTVLLLSGSDRDALPIKYSGLPSEDPLVDFINTHCGTARTPDGGLMSMAGRLPALDEIAKAYYFGMDAITAQRHMKEIIAKYPEGKAPPTAKFYLMALKRLTERGKEHLELEVDRLQEMLHRSQLTDEKKDEFYHRINILRAFQKEPKDEVVRYRFKKEDL